MESSECKFLFESKSSNTLTILPRHDTEDNWLQYNPVLKEREFVVSIDNDMIGYKLGDGKSQYSELRFVDLFRAITLGYIYLPQQEIIDNTKIKKVKLQLFDKTMWETFKESGYTEMYDRLGKKLITKENLQ